MKSLLFLSLVAAAIYVALLLHNPLPDPNSAIATVKAEATPPAGGPKSSWASDLGSLKPQIVSQPQPPTPWYDRKPRPKLQMVDERPAEEAKPAVAASPKPKTVSSKRRLQAPSQMSGRVAVSKSGYQRPQASRRAERRSRKSYGRAYLLGR